MLAASQEDTSRGYRGVTSTVQLLSKFVPTIQSFTTHPRGSMAEQLNMLQQSRTVCLVAAASSSLASVFLTRGLDTALCTWNLRILAQLLFVDGPVACTATTTLVNTYACRASSPLIAFPVGSPLCTLMSSSCSCYELLHRRNSSMKVRHCCMLLLTMCSVSCNLCRKPWTMSYGTSMMSGRPDVQNCLGKPSHLPGPGEPSGERVCG